MRADLSLAGAWTFMPDLRDDGLAAGWHRPGPVDARWSRVPVPAPWDTYDPAFRGYEGVAWLRRAFRWTGPRPLVARLAFAGAGHRADVWLNGRPLGGHDGGTVPFGLDARPALRRGTNLLAIRIRHVFSDATHPIRNTDWWKYGGITRNVTLATSPDAVLDRVTAVVTGRADAPRVVVGLRVRPPRPGLTVDAALAGGGRALRSARRAVPASGADGFSLPAAAFPRWSPDRPTLVRLVVSLRDRTGRIVDRVTRRIGIRVLDWRDGRLTLNGSPLWLRGVNQVEEYPAWTCSPSRAVMRARILDLKRTLRANFFRAAHYPHHPAFLDLCDELGLLTAGEIPLCYTEERPGTTAAGKAMLDELVWRDAHHPSVIWWSTGNERPAEKPAVARGITALIRHARALDPSRPVTCVTNRGLGDRSLAAHDLLALNSYLGVWGGTTPSTTRGLARNAGELRRWLDAVRRRFPGKPVVITEFGAPGFPVGGDAFGGERFQAEVFRVQLPVLARHPAVSGAVAWCYVDQRMGSYGKYPVGYLGSTQLEVFGLKTLDGRLKPAGRVVAGWFRRLARR